MQWLQLYDATAIPQRYIGLFDDDENLTYTLFQRSSNGGLADGIMSNRMKP